MISIKPFDNTQDGHVVLQVRLNNSAGMEAHFLSYGAILQRLLVPDKSGNKRDVVLGFEDLKSYEADTSYIGQLVGRNANRIANAQIELDNKKIALTANEGKNQLHGGFESFGKKVWEVTNLGDEVVFSYLSADGEEGFPGELETKFFVKLTNDNTLVMRYEAKTDKETIVNLTRHEYFNLDAGLTDSVLGHQLRINAESYLPINKDNIPTGQVLPVAETPLDLREDKKVSEFINRMQGGFDHNFVLNNHGNKPAAVLSSSDNNLKMELYCSQPGLQFYSADGMVDFHGKNMNIPGPSAALCLEAQHFPDTPNHDNFPTTILKPNQLYSHHLSYKFYYD